MVIDFPDAIATRVRDGLATYYGFAVNSSPGEAKAAFIKRKVSAELKDHIKAVERNAAVDAAAVAANNAAESELLIT